MGSIEKYRVVPMTTLVSPCRGCREGICDYRNLCPALAVFLGECDHEFTGYGVCDVNIYGEQSAPSAMKIIEMDEVAENDVSENKVMAAKGANHFPAAETPAPPSFVIQAGTTTAIQPAPTVAPEPKASLIPADMTLDQFFPPGRMAQFAKSVQLSLF